MDADEMAVLVAAVLEELGIPYRFRVVGDGEKWISVETVAGPPQAS